MAAISGIIINMGRARSNRHDGVIKNFDGVLGSGRGSLAAQARRDAVERADEERERELVTERAREDALSVFAEQLEAFGSSWNLALTLTEAYKGGYHKAGAPAYEKLIKYLAAMAGAKYTLLAQAADLGDPEGWPGLTAPAVTALGIYFGVLAKWPSVSDQVDEFNEVAERVVRVCLRGPHSLEHYQRLEPICQGIGSYLASRDGDEGMRLAMKLAQTLGKNVPAEAFAGPLSSWQAAWEQAIV